MQINIIDTADLVEKEPREILGSYFGFEHINKRMLV